LYSTLIPPAVAPCAFSRHPPDDGLVEAEIAGFDRFWQCQFLGTGLSCTQASDIGAPSAENVDFVVIQTHLSLNQHSPDSCRVVRQIAPFPSFRHSCAVGAGCRWGWNEPAPCRALKIAEFFLIEARLSREFGSDT
jgi:hypothetical protein